jgi:hypothetical protein
LTTEEIKMIWRSLKTINFGTNQQLPQTKLIQGVSRTDRSRIVQAVMKYLPAVVVVVGGGAFGV